MTITLEGSGGLFTIFKKVVSAIAAANTAQGTTVPDAIDEILAETADADTVAGMPRAARLSQAANSYKSNMGLQRELATFFRSLLVHRVTADAVHVPSTVDLCVTELIRQMDAAGTPETVERNVVSASVTTSPSSPTGAPTLLVTATGGDGKTLQRIIPETITGRYQTASTLLIESGATERDKLSPTWPKGSGVRATIAIDEDGLLSNQSFDLDTIQANSPDSWIVTVGTIGTTLALSVTEIQSITITGGPTSGFWSITFTRTDGIVQVTAPLSFDATAAEVQEALAALDGLEAVEVTSSGTLPSDVVYTVAFNSVAPPGNQSALSVTQNFNTGSASVAEVTAGQTAYEFRSLKIIGNGSQLTALRQPLHTLALSPSTCYGFSLQLKASEASLAGTLIAELIDSAGIVLTDGAGADNRLTVVLNTVSHTAFGPVTAFFRTPATLPDVFYLQIRLSAAMANTKILYLDDCLLLRMTELYRGGPLVALAANQRSLQSTDRYVITAANDFAGSIQTYFGRIFDRQLPSATSGAETIPD